MMAAGNCVFPHMAAGNGLRSRSDLVILWMTFDEAVSNTTTFK